MRKSYDGLSALVKNALCEDPTSGHLFVFINRRRTRMLAKAGPELLHVSVRHATDTALIVFAASNATDELQIRLESGSLSARSAGALARFRGQALWLVLRKSPIVGGMREIAQFTIIQAAFPERENRFPFFGS